jgi:hypothetical protein
VGLDFALSKSKIGKTKNLLVERNGESDRTPHPWTLVPGHFFILILIFFGGNSFFVKKNLIFSLFLLSFSLSFSLSL